MRYDAIAPHMWPSPASSSTPRRLSITLEIVVGWLVDHKETCEFLERYVALLVLPTDQLRANGKYPKPLAKKIMKGGDE